jgi:ribonuclease HII
MGTHYIVGVDEVGRGALAGPVVVAMVCVPKGFRTQNFGLGKLRDSKKLSAKKRERWFKFLQGHPKINYVLARVYPRAIERINISQAANLAAFRAFQRLIDVSGLSLNNCDIFLDGGLFLGKKNRVVGAKTVIRGDEKIPAIKIASILAKVSRDRLMRRLAKRYPAYGFEKHKGYGTKKHRQAIKKYGPSEAHRLTFLKKYHKI